MSNLTVTGVLAAFARYVGIGEHPPGSNKNAITAWYGLVGAWCAMCLSKVLADVGLLKEVLGHAMSYTVDIYDRGKAQGWLVDPRGKYQPLDIILFHFGDPHWGGRPLGIHHVGMCITDLGGGQFASYEGNTGDDCRKRVRAKSNVAAVVRPPWAKWMAATPAPTTPQAPAKPKPAKKHTSLLKRGSKGDDVRFLQRYLIAKGYSCGKWGADGVFGDATAAAVRRYQQKRLPRTIKGANQWDGIVGPNTWRLIDAGK